MSTRLKRWLDILHDPHPFHYPPGESLPEPQRPDPGEPETPSGKPWMGSPAHELSEARKRIDDLYADLAQVREQRDALQLADEARAAINVGLREQVARHEKALRDIQRDSKRRDPVAVYIATQALAVSEKEAT